MTPSHTTKGLLPAGLLLLSLTALTGGCEENDRCGPPRATVVNVVDGDTFDLDDGTRVRMLMIDTPETTGGADECYGEEAKQFALQTLLGADVELSYDQECEDQYGRLLAYVSINGREINALMVERGYACVLYIPPNGADRRDEYDSLEYLAENGGVGMWGACTGNPCD